MRLITYKGHQTKKGALIKGQVINTEPEIPGHSKKWYKNLKRSIKRYTAKGIAGKTVTIKSQGKTKRIRTDKQGNYTTYLKLKGTEWQTYTAMCEEQEEKGEVYLEEEQEEAIITDIDDTFLISHSTKPLRKLKLLLFKNAKTRKVVKDMPEVYHKIAGPVFYISNSQWQLYDLLEEFREANKLPKGPMLLREEPYTIKNLIKKHKQSKDKSKRIKTILKNYNYRYILIGDDGQEDPEVYHKIAHEQPEKISAIYIRHVRGKKRKEEVESMLAGTGKPYYISDEPKEFIKHYKKLRKKEKEN